MLKPNHVMIHEKTSANDMAALHQLASVMADCIAIFHCNSDKLVASIPCVNLHHSGHTAGKDERISQGFLGCREHHGMHRFHAR
jgi:RecJ-like exonuclease